MKRRMLGLFAAVFFVACGQGSDTNTGGGYAGGGNTTTPTTNTTTTTSSSASCCLNGAFYECPSGTAAQACFNNFSPGSCSRKSSRDIDC